MDTVKKVITGILAGCLLMGMTVFADNQPAVMETYTGESEVSVYVRGMEAESGEIGIQIATAEADSVQVQPISGLDVPMQTTVMIDNSVSIPEADRGKIAELLQDLIADRMEKEEIRIASFSEDVNMLTDYTSDYGMLKKAVDSIAYQNQETYLTDVLYDLLSEEYIDGGQDVYRRIIIISDGVDNKSLGYTKDELYALLKSSPVPIYTVGCINGKNNEELENMFALSRMTSVEYFLLDEVEDILVLTQVLKQDRGLCKLTIVPPAQMMDWSRKNIRITLAGNTVLSVEAAMPQRVYTAADMQEIEEDEEPPVEEEVPEEPEELEETSPALPDNPDAVVLTEESPDVAKPPFIAIVVIIVVVIAAVPVLFFLMGKKGTKAKDEPVGAGIPNMPGQSFTQANEKTELIGRSANEDADSDSTVMIWDESGIFEMILTDVDSPAKSFQAPLDHPVVIGRKKGMCDITLDYEKSVSGRHCEISARGGRFYIKDLQSSNGTCLNGNKVWAESEIFSGDVLKLGRLEMRFEVR